MDLKVTGSSPVSRPILLNKNYIKKNTFFYEAFVWKYSIDIINDLNLQQIDKSSNLLGNYYSITISNLLHTTRLTTCNDNDISNIWNWYYLYYINFIFTKNLTINNFDLFEKYNTIVTNFKSKQFRLSIISSKNNIFNLSVGRVLASLNINEKSKKKSDKGERLFVEFLLNFFKKNNMKFGLNKYAIFKIIGLKKKNTIRDAILKSLNINFNILFFINDFNMPNSYSKFKKIRSIKRRLKKRIVKNEKYI